MALPSFFGKKPTGNDRPGEGTRGDGNPRPAGERLDTTTGMDLTNLAGDMGRALAAAAGKIQVSESGNDDGAALEEAAILYANANTEGARVVLEAAVGSQVRPSEMLWRMLFDLYRLSGARQPFEERGVAYARQYEISPPVWDETDATAPGPAREAGPSVNLSGTLSGTARTQFEQLARIGAKAGMLRIDLGRLKGIDDTGCQLLVETISKLKQQKVKTALLGARHALAIAQARLKIGEPEARDFWQLALALLQQIGDEAAFEDMAVNFAVTFEESPPSWEALPIVNPDDKAARPTDSGGLELKPVSASLNCFVVDGEITGAQPEVLRKLAVFASERSRVEIDASKMRRLEFVSAGGLFNLLAQLQAQGKLTVIRHPNALVAALMRVMGIDQIAQIEMKP